MILVPPFHLRSRSLGLGLHRYGSTQESRYAYAERATGRKLSPTSREWTAGSLARCSQSRHVCLVATLSNPHHAPLSLSSETFVLSLDIVEDPPARHTLRGISF